MEFSVGDSRTLGDLTMRHLKFYHPQKSSRGRGRDVAQVLISNRWIDKINGNIKLDSIIKKRSHFFYFHQVLPLLHFPLFPNFWQEITHLTADHKSDMFRQAGHKMSQMLSGLRGCLQPSGQHQTLRPEILHVGFLFVQLVSQLQCFHVCVGLSWWSPVDLKETRGKFRRVEDDHESS